ncbi:hypothetical protein [Marinomonas fungiae]|uniref:hypothetical protein n=1 Tax=Marinomonas fungiae TaxID=1137284 RepID=UPI003A9144EE
MDFNLSKVSEFLVSEIREVINGATKVTGLPVTVAQTIHGLYIDKEEANETYRFLYPILIDYINRKGSNSTEVKEILDRMAKLPQYGIKRYNFKRKYINSPNGWRLLPKDPEDFSGTFWHGGLY